MQFATEGKKFQKFHWEDVRKDRSLFSIILRLSGNSICIKFSGLPNWGSKNSFFESKLLFGKLYFAMKKRKSFLLTEMHKAKESL